MNIYWAFTRFTKLLIELTQTSFFCTSNELEHLHLLVFLALNDRTSNFEHSSDTAVVFEKGLSPKYEVFA